MYKCHTNKLKVLVIGKADEIYISGEMVCYFQMEIRETKQVGP